MRSTNVYEEQSLGIFHDNEEEEDEEKFETSGPRMTVWSRYLAMHARRQLAFGKFSVLSGGCGRVLHMNDRYVVVGFGSFLFLYH